MKTKEIITTSMFNLLKLKPFNEITVQNVLDDCKVSRSTFYRYFKDMFDLMNWCYQSYVDTLIQNVYDGTENWENTLYLIYAFLNDNHEYFENASNVEGRNSFWNFLYEYSFNFYKTVYLKNTQAENLSTKAIIFLEFNTMGSVFLVKQWFHKGRKESISDMAKWTYELIPEMYRNFL